MEATCLLIDLRNYTLFVLQNKPKTGHKFLQYFYRVVEKTALKYQGRFSSALGDSVGIAFNKKNHACRALKAGKEILKQLRENNFPLEANCGLATGELDIKTFKAKNLLFNSLIGYPIIAAYRLENLAAKNGHKILIEENAYQLLDKKLKKEFEKLGKIKLKGFKKKKRVYGLKSYSLSSTE